MYIFHVANIVAYICKTPPKKLTIDYSSAKDPTEWKTGKVWTEYEHENPTKIGFLFEETSSQQQSLEIDEKRMEKSLFSGLHRDLWDRSAVDKKLDPKMGTRKRKRAW